MGGGSPKKEQKRYLTGVVPSREQGAVVPEIPSFAEPTTPQDQASLYWDEIQKIRQNRGPALSAYQKALTEQPTRETTKPSIARKLLGAFVGFGAAAGGGAATGINAARGVVEAPYERAMGEYKNKISGLGESAKLEQDEVQAEIEAAMKARALGLDYDKYLLDKKDREFDNNVNKTNAETARARAQAYIKNLDKKDYNYEPQEDGSILAINKNDPNDKKTIPAKTIAAGQLRVGQRNAATGEYNAETARTNSITNRANVASQINFRNEDLKLKAKNGGKVSPSQQAYAFDNALRELVTQSRYKDYIVPNENGTYSLEDDDGSPVYEQLKKEIRRKAQNSIDAGAPFDDTDELEDDGSIIIGPPR